MEQPVPVYIQDDLDRVIKRDFDLSQEQDVFSRLKQYGIDARHLEVLRVRMACLKFSEGNIEKLRQAVTMACDDFREILVLTEYKNYMKAKTPEAQAAAILKDYSQLQEWLGRSFNQ